MNVLFKEEARFQQHCSHYLNMPTLVIIDPKDELISYPKLVQQVRQFQLTNYQILTLNADLRDRVGGYHHLILDRETMGASNWETATNAIAQHLFNSDK